METSPGIVGLAWPSLRFSPSMWLGLAGSLAFTAVELLAWPIQERVTWLGMVGVWLPALVALAGSGIWSAVHARRYVRSRGLQALVPLLLALLVLSSYLSGTTRALVVDANHRLNRDARQAVVTMLQTGQLSPLLESDGRPLRDAWHRGVVYRLPPGFQHLSSGGLITVGQDGPTTEVIFFTTRDLLEEFSGYTYRSDDSSPGYGQLRRPLGDQWHFVLLH